MSKGNSMFCYPEYIAAQISQLFEGLGEKKRLTGLDLEVFASGGASFLAALNAIHCFRDGNGRAQLSFMTLLCHRAGHPIDFGRFNQAAFLEAMIMSFGGDERQLTRLIQDVCRRL
jgi:cell filamentation protein